MDIRKHREILLKNNLCSFFVCLIFKFAVYSLENLHEDSEKIGYS